jgi:hypothetical protein
VVALKYVIIGIVVVVAAAAALVLILHTAHQVPVQYVGSPNGYEAFVPSSQTINYNGHTDPVGTLILPNGTTLTNVIWNGQYANTIIQNHNQIVQLNNQLNGNMQDFYVIKGQVPIQQVTINGQTYYVVLADKINPGDIAGFYTYDKWVPKFEVAMNMPGTYAAVLPGNSPVFQWTNTTGTVVYETYLYQQNNPYYFTGGYVLVLSNGTIIPYGMTKNVLSATFNNYFSPPQVYNPSS